MKTLLEAIASECHDQWSGWMNYLFSCSTENENGSVTIPVEKVLRWQRQRVLEYRELPEEEKESDRVQAEKFLYLIRSPHLINCVVPAVENLKGQRCLIGLVNDGSLREYIVDDYAAQGRFLKLVSGSVYGYTWVDILTVRVFELL